MGGRAQEARIVQGEERRRSKAERIGQEAEVARETEDERKTRIEEAE